MSKPLTTYQNITQILLAARTLTAARSRGEGLHAGTESDQAQLQQIAQSLGLVDMSDVEAAADKLLKDGSA